MEDQAFLDEITTDWERLREQKARPSGGVEPRVLLNLAMGAGEQHVTYSNRQIITQPLDPNKLNLVFNIIDARVSKLTGRLCAVGGTYKSNPSRRDPQAFHKSEIYDRMIKALDQELDQPSKTRQLIFWLLYGGTAFEYTPWIRNAKMQPKPQFGPGTLDNPQGELLYKDIIASEGSPEPAIVPQSEVDRQVSEGRPQETFQIHEVAQEDGEVGSEILGPLQVFMDQGVKCIEELAPDQAVYLAFVKTQGWIAENYGDDKIADLDADDDIRIISTRFEQPEGSALAGMSLKDIIPCVQGTRSEDDPPMNVVIHRFQPHSQANPRGRYTCFVPGKKILYDDVCPYEEIPLTDFHFKPVTTSFWTGDYVTNLIAPQRFINKRLSQLGEQANASIYDKILLGAGISEKDIPSDYPGFVKNAVAENGAPLVQRLPGPSLPSWFLDSIDLVIKMMNDIAGGGDLTENTKFPGQLRGPMAVPMLQEIMDTEWGPFYEHFGHRMARVKQMRMNRVKQFYPPLRTMHYMDRDQRDEVFEFHTDEILKAGIDYNVTVERGSLIPELRALREARVRERLASPLSILYLNERTGQLDKSKIAADLQFGDAGRDSRESQYRKLGAEIVGRLWEGKPLPPVMPFYAHEIMMDELEAGMATTEFMSASPQIQQAFFLRWQQHMQYLQQAAMAQQQSMQNQMVHSAVAQATAQTAAQTAAETVQASMGQIRAQAEAATMVPATLNQAFKKVQG